VVCAGAARAGEPVPDPAAAAGAASTAGGDPALFLPPAPPVPPLTAAAFQDPPAAAGPPGTDGARLMSSAEGRALYLPVINREAARRGLPPALADAVATVESGYRTGAVGTVGEVGLMQVRPTTAAMLGYRGSLTGLFAPETNIEYGVAYLAEAWRLTGGQVCESLMKYRAGHGETRMTQRSVDYCVRARRHLAAIGSPLAQAPVPQAVAETAARPAPALPARAGTRAPAQRGAAKRASRRAAWAAHEARFKAIQSKVSAATLRIMQ